MSPTFRCAVLWVGLALCTHTIAQGGPHRPIANAGPVDIDFGEVNIGHTAIVPVTLRNLTASPMTLAGGGVSSTVGFGAQGGSCSSPLSAGASCTINYRYRPNTRDGSEQVGGTSLLLTADGQSRFVTLTLRGRGVGTMIDFSPTRFDFGEVLLGQTVSVAITLENPLTEPVNFAGGGFNSSNGFSYGGGTCSGALAAGASCTFIYTFTPGAQGPLSNSTALLIGLSSGSGPSQLYPVDVSGTGVLDPGLVTAAPIDFDFGLVRFGRRAQTRLRYTNVTATPVSVGGGGFPPDPDGLAFAGINEGGAGCASGTVAAGSTCTARYEFTPREARAHAEQTSFTFFQGQTADVESVSLAGTGVGPLGQIYPVEADLGEVDLGTSAPVTVTVRNDGEFDLTNFIGGAAASPFSSSSTCTSSLAPGAQCTYTFTYNASTFALGPRELQTSISFGNALGMQRTQLIVIRAFGTARMFVDGFE